MSEHEPVIDPRAQGLLRRAGAMPGGNAAVSANPDRADVTTSFAPTPPFDRALPVSAGPADAPATAGVG